MYCGLPVDGSGKHGVHRRYIRGGRRGAQRPRLLRSKRGAYPVGRRAYAAGTGSYRNAERLPEKCLHTAVETCGYFKKDDLPALAETADLLLWDIKDTDEARHRQNTGVSLAPILQNLYAADRLGIKIRLRCICLAGVNANEAHFRRVRAIAQRLDHLLGIDLLPYHPMGKSKYERLGLPDDFDNDRYIPSKEKIEQLRGFVTQGVTFLKHENS